MKKRKFRLFISLQLLLSVLFFQPVIAATTVNDTSIVKKFALSSAQEIKIKLSSKQTQIKTWDNSELFVQMIFQIELKNEKDFPEFWSALQKNINLSSPENINLSLGISKMINTVGNIKIQFSGSSKTFELDKFEHNIVVYASKHHKLSLNQSFGTLSLEDMEADVDLKLSSAKFSMGNCKNLNLDASFCSDLHIGNTANAKMQLNSSNGKMGIVNGTLALNANFSKLFSENITGNADFELNSSSFSTKSARNITLKGSFIRNFDIQSIENGEFNVSSSEISIHKVGNADIKNCSFATFRIEESAEIEILRSSSSHFFLDKNASFTLTDGSFTDIKISELSENFKALAKSGNISILKISKNFKNIDISGEFADIVLSAEPEAEFNFAGDFDFTKHEIKGVNMNYTNKDMSKETLKGAKGNGKQTSQISINCKSCTLKLK
jgi:hypothetical protein